MARSIATARPVPPPRPRSVTGRLRARLDGLDPTWIGVAVFVAALVIYVASNPARQNLYDHFVWQADAYLHGRFAITWPLVTDAFRNDYFQDVYPLPSAPGYALLPFPPLPAVLLTPFVALGGLGTDAALLVACLGAVNVALAWRLTSHVTDDRLAALSRPPSTASGRSPGTRRCSGSTWFAAHVVASFFLFLGITLAVDGEDRDRARAAVRRLPLDGRQFVAGLVFGVAAMARLTTILGLPFFALVGSGGSVWRRGLSAALGAAIPVALLLAYNLASSGQLFEPGYDYLYQTETVPIPGGRWPRSSRPSRPSSTTPARGTRRTCATCPRTLVIMLAWLPTVQPQCGLEGLFSTTCALVRPDPLGTSLLLTSPAYLLPSRPGGRLARPRGDWRDRWQWW